VLKRLLLPTLLLALAAFALAACGDSESDEDKLVDVIETSATSTDPADCKELLTVGFLEQVEGSEGQEAIEECEEDAEDEQGNPDSVEVTEVEVDGSAATANAAFEGGDFDGQTINIGLVEQDGDWKLDQIEEFVVFDRQGILASLEEGLEESGNPELGECVLEELGEYSDEELEEAILEGFAEAVEEAVESCV